MASGLSGEAYDAGIPVTRDLFEMARDTDCAEDPKKLQRFHLSKSDRFVFNPSVVISGLTLLAVLTKVGLSHVCAF
jgi:hypothetical protein